MSMQALLLLSCVHLLGLGLDLGNSLYQIEGEGTHAHTQVTELPKRNQRLIFNDTRKKIMAMAHS